MEYQAVSSIDDEGNGFNIVNGIYGLGHYDSTEKDFTLLDYFEECDLDKDDVNAVYIN